MTAQRPCRTCGSPLPDGAKECPRDGTPVGQEASADEVWESTVRKDVLVGHQIGEYVVRRRIGSGGMGVVYEGEHPVIGRKVAIKFIRPDSSGGVRSRELVGEARAASAIRHRGIIDIFGFGTLPGIGQYLVMEFLNGRPLDEVIMDRAPIPPAEVIRFAIEMLGALAAAHAVGVIHRDLKPGNIFVVLESSGSENVKVLDFGLAKQGATPNGSTPQSSENMVVGTPEYMAPEQACGQEVSPRTDLYAVGIILFEMLTGRLPFRGDSPMQTAIMQVQTPPPAPSSFVDGLPSELNALVLRLLAKEPERRPASAEAVERELKAISKMLAFEMTRLSGFARAIPEPTPEPVSAVRAQVPQGTPGTGAQRGGTRQHVAAPASETVEAPRTSSRPALTPPPAEAPVRSKRPAAPPRPQTARSQPAQEPAPRTQRLMEEPPREVRRGAKAPDTVRIARMERRVPAERAAMVPAEPTVRAGRRGTELVLSSAVSGRLGWAAPDRSAVTDPEVEVVVEAAHS
ncbi:serine/threonine-protein kinase [Vitiosangium sp. GDMCC 1.1324]|uniref:serine/threonine-protein kinase n=1 Tax=Vitiosangium sp. (strain GDMCC 1.1324) TaxID=2138576 RepID=UPI00130ECF8D|nr:serine/threonine protein kinase [Vitiosangium sp. GDMCC 1.1324]